MAIPSLQRSDSSRMMTGSAVQALGAEIVVTFEAASELGDTFMARQSYLTSEIHWGHTFVNVIRPAPPGDTQHEVDLSRYAHLKESEESEEGLLRHFRKTIIHHLAQNISSYLLLHS